MKFLLIYVFFESAFFSLANCQILEIYEEAKDIINTASLEVIYGLEEVTNAEKGKKLEEDLKTTKSLTEQKNTLQEIQKLTEDLSDALKRYSEIKKSYVYLKETISLYNALKGRFKEDQNISPERLRALNDAMFSIIVAQKNCFKNIKTILSKDQSRMNEGARLKLIYGENEKMAYLYHKMKQFEPKKNRLSYL